MKWLQLDCDISNNPKIRALKRKMGAEAFSVYIDIITNVGLIIEEKNKLDNSFGYLPVTYQDDLELFADDVCCIDDFQKFLSICDKMAALQLIDKKTWEEQRIIYCPNVIERADNFAKRWLKNHEHSDNSKPIQKNLPCVTLNNIEKNSKTNTVHDVKKIDTSSSSAFIQNINPNKNNIYIKFRDIYSEWYLKNYKTRKTFAEKETMALLNLSDKLETASQWEKLLKHLTQIESERATGGGGWWFLQNARTPSPQLILANIDDILYSMNNGGNIHMNKSSPIQKKSMSGIKFAS